jgi:hypothetical protein
MAKAQDWTAILEPLYGKKCTLRDVGYCGEKFAPKIIDQAKEKRLVDSIIEDVIGGWDFLEEQFGKEPGTLVMFATNSGTGDDATALFYDRTSGQVYKYEEASFDDTGYRLDQLRLQAAGASAAAKKEKKK